MNQHHSFDNDILDALTPDMPAEREAFTADTLDKADWAARKAAAIQADLAQKEQAAKLQIQRIQAWLDNERTKAADDANFFEGHAVNYLLQVRQSELDKGTKPDKLTKTIKLPGGAELRARQLPDKFNVDDENAAIKWAEANESPILVIKKTISKTEVARTVKTTGEMPDGITIEPGHIKISLSLPKE